LDSIATRLAVIEAGWRYPDLWHVNQDLVQVSGWTRGVPQFRSRIQELGERYARVAFIPAPGLPPKYVPRPRIEPSLRPGHDPKPISDDEAAAMIAALDSEEELAFDDAETEVTRPSSAVLIGKRSYRPGRLWRALDSGLLAGGPAEQLDSLLETILIAMSGRGVSTIALRNAANALADSFPRGANWIENRFAMLRRRLIKDGYLRRFGKSFWQRTDQMDVNRVRAAFALLDRLEEEGAQPIPKSGSRSIGKDGRR